MKHPPSLTPTIYGGDGSTIKMDPHLRLITSLVEYVSFALRSDYRGQFMVLDKAVLLCRSVLYLPRFDVFFQGTMTRMTRTIIIPIRIRGHHVSRRAGTMLCHV